MLRTDLSMNYEGWKVYAGPWPPSDSHVHMCPVELVNACVGKHDTYRSGAIQSVRQPLEEGHKMTGSPRDEKRLLYKNTSQKFKIVYIITSLYFNKLGRNKKKISHQGIGIVRFPDRGNGCVSQRTFVFIIC